MTVKIVAAVEKIFSIAKKIVKMTNKIFTTTETAAAAAQKTVYSVKIIV